MDPPLFPSILGHRKITWLKRFFIELAISCDPILKASPTLSSEASRLIEAAWEDSTWSSYGSAVNSYFLFCSAHGIPNHGFPINTSRLVAWVTYCFSYKQLAASTVTSYLSALKSCMSMADFDITPFRSQRLRYTMRGMSKLCPKRFNSKPRLPITVWLLLTFFQSIGNTTLENQDAIKAALAIGVYGLLRGAEFLSKSNSLNPLTRADVSWFDDRVELLLRSSKTDYLKKGVRVVIYRNDSPTCPWTLLKKAWDAAPVKAPYAPAVQVADGSPISYSCIQRAIKTLAAAVGLDPASFASHSLRIGGATTLAMLGVPASIIKEMGRWKSVCYQLYTRVSQSQLRAVFRAVGEVPQVCDQSAWFGGSDVKRACRWAVGDLEKIAMLHKLPDGVPAVNWSC